MAETSKVESYVDGEEEKSSMRKKILGMKMRQFKKDQFFTSDQKKIFSVVTGAVIGCLVGVLLSSWIPADDAEAETKETVVLWIGLIGDMFLRALNAVVLPLVFINIILATYDLLEVGKAGVFGRRTFGLYFLTTFLAATIGVCFAAIFSAEFGNAPDDDTVTEYLFTIGCGTDGGVLGADGTELTCEVNTTDYTYFTLNDVNGQFASADSGDVESELSLSDTFYSGIFEKIVPNNIVGAFYEASFAAVVFFALAFGVAVQTTKVGDDEAVLVPFLREIDRAFIKLIHWIIYLTPVAVISLIASALGTRTDLEEVFASVGFLILSTALGMITHLLIMHCGIFYLITRRNPFGYMRFIIPAQTMALASASSVATLPVNLDCVKNTGEVPDSIRKFVLSIGATINMDGAAIYFIPAITFMAANEGITLGIAQYILIIIIATVGSAGTAPVPSSGLVLILTAYNTVAGVEGQTPASFAFVVAVDWLTDRFSTALNVTGDAMVARLLTSLMGMTGDYSDEGLEAAEAAEAAEEADEADDHDL